MARKSELPPGLEDRKPSNVIRARLRQQDAKGEVQNLRASFPYNEDVAASHPQSRTSAIVAAKAWLEEQRRALRFDGTPVGSRLQDQTLGGWVQRYIDEAEEAMVELAAMAQAKADGQPRAAKRPIPAHARKKGIAQECTVLRSYLREFPKLMARAPDQVTREHLDQVRDWLRYERTYRDGTPATVKPASINRNMDILSAVYNTARKDRNWNFDVANPIKGLPKLKAETAKEQPRKGELVTNAELTQILAKIPEASLETRCCICFLRWSGGRRSEALRLDWSDVDFDKEIPEVTFRDTKDPLGRQRQRTIPLNRHAVQALYELLAGKPKPAKGRVFPLAKDTPTQAFIRGRDRAGIHKRLHDMRHTRTTEVTSDLPVHEAQQITGHLDARMLMHYYHPDAQHLGAKLEKADAERAAAAVNKQVGDKGLLTLTPEQLTAMITKAVADALKG
ncbi:site-specific integrase [Dyella sp. 2HG41-7]|uniref:tyrosine-type recombinase/integrase n=1 Tax=Dyella sp. 2HG41-7 TaxID=2883239 RepID=UPI001F2EF56B|nr:site-specific integrase [Dyella sp. 2HG41-7]